MGQRAGLGPSPTLTAIAERLALLEAERTPDPVDPTLLVAPEQVWESWTLPQRRESLRVQFDRVTIRARHVGDPTRITITWSTT